MNKILKLGRTIALGAIVTIGMNPAAFATAPAPPSAPKVTQLSTSEAYGAGTLGNNAQTRGYVISASDVKNNRGVQETTAFTVGHVEASQGAKVEIYGAADGTYTKGTADNPDEVLSSKVVFDGNTGGKNAQIDVALGAGSQVKGLETDTAVGFQAKTQGDATLGYVTDAFALDITSSPAGNGHGNN